MQFKIIMMINFGFQTFSYHYQRTNDVQFTLVKEMRFFFKACIFKCSKLNVGVNNE